MFALIYLWDFAISNIVWESVMQEIFFGISLRKTDRFSEIQITPDLGDKNQNSRKSTCSHKHFLFF